MKLREFLTVFEQSDRLRIVKNEKDVYTGFLALMAHAGNMEALMTQRLSGSDQRRK